MTLPEQQPTPKAEEQPTERPARQLGFRVQTGLRAGDVYIQHPRGSNNRLDG